MFASDRTWNSTVYDETLDDIMFLNDQSLSTTFNDQSLSSAFNMIHDSEVNERPRPGLVKHRSASLEQNIISPEVSPDKRSSLEREMLSPKVEKPINELLSLTPTNCGEVSKLCEPSMEHREEMDINELSSNSSNGEIVSPLKSPLKSPNKSHKSLFNVHSPTVLEPINHVESSPACSENDGTESVFVPPDPTTWKTNPIYSTQNATKENIDHQRGLTNNRTELFEQKARSLMKPPAEKVKVSRTSSERIKNWQNRIDAQKAPIASRPVSMSIFPGKTDGYEKLDLDVNEVNNNVCSTYKGVVFEKQNIGDKSTFPSQDESEVSMAPPPSRLDEYYNRSAPDDTLIRPSKLRESLRKKDKTRPSILDDLQYDSGNRTKEPKRRRFNRMKRNGRHQSDLGPAVNFWKDLERGSMPENQLKKTKQISLSTSSPNDLSNDLSNEIDTMLTAVEKEVNGGVTPERTNIFNKNSVHNLPATPTDETLNFKSTAVFSPYDNVTTEDLDRVLQDLELEDKKKPRLLLTRTRSASVEEKMILSDLTSPTLTSPTSISPALNSPLLTSTAVFQLTTSPEPEEKAHVKLTNGLKLDMTQEAKVELNSGDSEKECPYAEEDDFDLVSCSHQIQIILGSKKKKCLSLSCAHYFHFIYTV